MARTIGIGTIRLGFAIAVGLSISAAPAEALTVCQKESNPKRTKVREACRENEVEAAVNDVWVGFGTSEELPDGADPVEVAAMPLGPGSYLIQAIVRVSGPVLELASCTLTAEDEDDTTARLIDGNPLLGDPHDIVLTVAEVIGEPTVVTVTCSATGGGDPGALVQNARIFAQHVGRVVSPVF
jgi:hypothetical protein